MVINQGDIYWISLDVPGDSEPGITHPHVVIQNNIINRSRIDTLVVCGLTTNAKRAKSPGNVLLEIGEANLPKQSIVVVSQVSTVDKSQLGDYIGSLTQERINQIFAGMQFLQKMTEHQSATKLKINKIHHVAIICSDYSKSKKFYVDILKFSIINETYRAERDSYKLDLKVSDRDTLELFSFPSPPPRPSKLEACGLRHLAFEVDNIEENVDCLVSQGVNVEPIRIDEITGKKFTFFKDPDDLPLEIYEM